MRSCIVDGKPLSGRQVLYCSQKCTDTAYLQRRGSRPQHGEYLARRARGYYHDFCPQCGHAKTKVSKRCNDCERNFPSGLSRVERNRLAVQRHSAKSHGPINPNCPNHAVCETAAPHRHCDCGWPISPTTVVCHICIAEQTRVEFRTWEEVA